VLRVVAIADSDSYLKWSASTLAAMPSAWQSQQWLIRSPIAPSPAQVLAATSRRVDRVTLAGAVRALWADPPDVLLLAATGPVAQAVLAFGFLRGGARRPLLVTGLPGISIPATERALEFRSGCDLFVVHSHREVTEFAAAAERIGLQLDFGLATLPFIREARAGSQPLVSRPDRGRRRKIVFAAQAIVPAELEDRQRVLRSFATLPPEQQVVIKLRALPGEQQTHRENLPYPELWNDLVAGEGLDRNLIRFAGGSMADALADADGFVTVSSTAALEAIGMGVPIIVLTDFGVSAEAINEVFIGSGCQGSLDDVAAGEFRQPDSEWLWQNYFHEPTDNDWTDRIAALVEIRRQGRLQPRAVRPVDGRIRLARRQLRLVLPRPVLRATGKIIRQAKRLRRRLRPEPVEQQLVKR
jgi:hypothetical protein